jgi:hypothetical protein
MRQAAPGPEEAYRAFEQEIELLRSAERTAVLTQDVHSSFYGLPYDDFVEELRSLQDEIESRAYLAIVAAVEATVQLDLRARMSGRSSVPLQAAARRLRREERQGRRIVLEDLLDAWAMLPGARRAPITEFKQLLLHRHWLAHGRYFTDRAGVPAGPPFAIERTRALLAELRRLDPAFPR